MDNLVLISEELPPFDELASQWREFDRLGMHDFFVTWTWMGTWLRILPSSVKPRLVRAMKGDELVGLATLTLTDCKLHGLIPVSQAWLNATGRWDLDQVMIEHNGFACYNVGSNELLQALVKSFSEGHISTDELLLPGVAESIYCKSKLIDAGRPARAYRAPLDRGRGIESLLSSNARQQLRRSFRAVRSIGKLSVDIAQDLSTAQQYFSDLKAMHVRWWERRGHPHAFTNAIFEKFHRTLITNGIGDQNVDLLRVTAGDQVLGYLYNFRRNGKISSYQTGFSNNFEDFRPGYICHALAMNFYANAGMTSYDFLAGSNRLKQSLGIQSYEVGWHQLRRKTVMFQIEAAARTIVATLKKF